MRKTILTIFTSVGLLSTVFAQDGIEIYVDGGATDYSSGNGVHVAVPVQGGEAVADIHVENHTGSSQDWLVTRLRINEQASWTDYLCWGHETDATGGTCFSASLMPTNPWTTPGATSVPVADGEAGVIAAHITPDFNSPGTVIYRYYISTDGQNFVDSVDVEVSVTLSLDNITTELGMTVSPNPATDFINVKANGVSEATLKVVDILGNIVREEKVQGQTKIDVMDLNNGVYFVILESDGLKPVNKKIVIRH